MSSTINMCLLLLSYAVVASEAASAHALPKPGNTCGCEFTNGKASFAPSLWLDIIFIVDVSRAMEKARLEKATKMIEDIVYSLTVGRAAANATKHKEKFSRVGIITAGDKSEMIAPFKPLNMSLTTSNQADIGSAIQLATRIFSSVASRSARQLIYIIAASDSSETGRYAHQCEERHDATCDVDKFKRNGGIIAVTEAHSSPNVEIFAELASPGYYETSLVEDSNYYLQALCYANCFCPPGLIPFSRPDAMNRNAPDGGCFFSHSSGTSYSTARKVCRASGARLATIRDQYEQFFLMKASGGKPFWIGGVSQGEQIEPYDDVNFIINTSSYTNWAAGEPNTSHGNCAISQQKGAYTSEWFSEDCSVAKKYMCELRPCSVDNYCE